jgi:hypothetical protein
MQATVLMALLQPDPETFDLFDDIMLLSEGVSRPHLPLGRLHSGTCLGRIWNKPCKSFCMDATLNWCSHPMLLGVIRALFGHCFG